MINSLTLEIRTYVHTTLMAGINSRKRFSGCDINFLITLYISLAQLNILNIKHVPLLTEFPNISLTLQINTSHTSYSVHQLRKYRT